jgi:hypothetical protein
MRRVLVVLACALMLTAGTSTVAAAQRQGQIHPPKEALGRSLGDWIGAWWQHYLALPNSESPLKGNGSRCGQVGRVVMPVYGVGFPADCTIKTGTWVLLNVWTGECSTAEGNGTTAGELTSCAVDLLHQYQPDTIAVTVDGREVADVWGSYGTSSELTVDLPADNLLATGPGTTPFVASGWAVVVHPLPPGTHVMQVCLTGAAVGPFNGCSDATIHVASGRD